MPTCLHLSVANPSKIRKVLLGAGMMIAVALAAPAFAGEDAPVAAPSFSLPSLNGQKIKSSDFQGKYLLINFWATWCGPCKVEMPSLETLHRKFKDRNLAVIAISNDIFGEQVVKPYIEARNFTFLVGLDPKLKASNDFGVINLPTTFLINPEGNIIGVLSGAEDWSDPKTLLYFDQLLTPAAQTTEKPATTPCKKNQKALC